VLEAMGLTDRQQRLFLELNRTLSSPALILEAQADSPQVLKYTLLLTNNLSDPSIALIFTSSRCSSSLSSP
jgi:hypothetical protein